MSELLGQIFERVRTYQIQKWRYFQSEDLNPYRLASVGYTCVSLNTLQCCICHHQLSITDEELVQRQLSEVKEDLANHEEHCEYKGQSGKTIEEAQLYLNMDQLTERTKHNYSKHKGKKLPLIRGGKVWQFFESNQRGQNIRTIMKKYDINQEEFRISFMLSVFGWNVVAESNETQLQCTFCGRIVNCENKELVENDKQIGIEVQNQKLFDPIGEHRYYCLWIYGIRGWNIYVQHLWDKLGEYEVLFKKFNPEEVKKIRVNLDKYLQTFSNTTKQSIKKINDIMDECGEIGSLLEEGEVQKEQLKSDFEKRKKSISEFIVSMNEEIKKPLKKIKID